MATSASPPLKALARRLLVHEIATAHPADKGETPPFLVCEKLRIPLGKLMGVSGFRLLLARAKTLSAPEFPWLRTLDINSAGRFENLSGLHEAHGARYIFECEVALIAQLLGLLRTFIGPALTLRLLQDIWPNLEDLTQ
jgi:hypothetical protein